MRLAALALCLLALACAPDPAASTTSAVVYGVDDRREVYEETSAVHRTIAETAIAVQMSASAIDERSPSSVRVTYSRTLAEAQDLCAGQRFEDQIEPGTCSGTLIDDRHILTAAHCVDDASACDGSQVWILGFYYESPGSLRALDRDDVYRCSRVLAYRQDAQADHAVVELDRPVVGHTPAPVRRTTSLALGTALWLIGHPNGIPMKVAGGGEVTSTGRVSLTATLDSFAGNSGSGVFDAEGNVVALLDSGADDYVRRGGCYVVNVIAPPPTDDGEGLTYASPAIDALCATPGVVSSLCGTTPAPVDAAVPPADDASTPPAAPDASSAAHDASVPVDAANPTATTLDGGCTCRAARRGSPSALAGLALGALGVLIRARSRRRAAPRAPSPAASRR